MEVCSIRLFKMNVEIIKTKSGVPSSTKEDEDSKGECEEDRDDT